MRFLLSSLPVLLIAGYSYSQAPVITQLDYYQLGGEYLRINKIDTELNSVSIGPSGSNVIWDFSTVDFDHPSVVFDTISCILPNGTPFFYEPGMNYDLSNYCLKQDTDTFAPWDDTYFYYRIENDSLNFIGDWADNGITEKWYYTFSDFRTDLIFPFTYSDTHTDLFEATYLDLSGGGTNWHYLSGSTEVTADGYGDLITPDGNTINNVVRVKEIITTVDSNAVSGVSDLQRTSYYWYSTDNEGPILQFDMHPELPDSVVNAYYLKKIDSVTSISELSEQTSINVYPNPTLNSFSIAIEGTTNVDLVISIYDYSGRLVKKKEYVGNTRAHTFSENLSSGIYFIELTNKNNLIDRRKLVVQ